MSARHRSTVLLLCAAAVSLASMTAVPRARSAACSCDSLPWRRPVAPRLEQPLSPRSTDRLEAAPALFAATMARLPAVLRRFQPEDWERGRIAVGGARGSSGTRATVRVDVDFRAGPARLRGDASVPVHSCRSSCGGTSRRVVFDFRGATGDLRGLVDWVAFDLCLGSHARPGWASMRGRVLYVPGESFPSGVFPARARRAEEFLVAQIAPFVAAVRDEYRDLREQRADAR